MAVNKVIFGTETLIDLTGDTVAPEVLLAGYTAHNASGDPVEGAALIPDDVKAALTEKGVTVPDGAGISDLAALISGIEANVLDYKVICGTYTPAKKITSNVEVYRSKSLGTSAKTSIVAKRCVGITFIIAPKDGASIIYPTPIYSFRAYDNSSGYSGKSSGSGNGTLIKAPFLTLDYKIVCYLQANTTYPMQVGNTYAWILLVPSDVDI